MRSSDVLETFQDAATSELAALPSCWYLPFLSPESSKSSSPILLNFPPQVSGCFGVLPELGVSEKWGRYPLKRLLYPPYFGKPLRESRLRRSRSDGSSGTRGPSRPCGSRPCGPMRKAPPKHSSHTRFGVEGLGFRAWGLGFRV